MNFNNLAELWQNFALKWSKLGLIKRNVNIVCLRVCQCQKFNGEQFENLHYKFYL